MKALEKYKEVIKKRKVDVRQCGLFVDPDNPYLCASPDGLVGSDGLVEIQCHFLARNEEKMKSAVVKYPSIGLRIRECKLHLPPTHAYYHQIQGQLQATGRKWC